MRASGYHAPDQRFAMVAGTRPIAWTKDQTRSLAQARTCSVGIERLQGQQSARKLLVTPMRQWRPQVPDGSQLVRQAIVADNLKMKDDRSRRHGALDHVQAHRRAAAIEQDMLARWLLHDPHVVLARIEGMGRPASHRPGGQDARVHGRRPDGPDDGAIFLRIFSESAAPSEQ